MRSERNGVRLLISIWNTVSELSTPRRYITCLSVHADIHHKSVTVTHARFQRHAEKKTVKLAGHCTRSLEKKLLNLLFPHCEFSLLLGGFIFLAALGRHGLSLARRFQHFAAGDVGYARQPGVHLLLNHESAITSTCPGGRCGADIDGLYTYRSLTRYQVLAAGGQPQSEHVRPLTVIARQLTCGTI